MIRTNGHILKIIGLTFTAIALLGSAVTSHYMAKEEAKEYTDVKVSDLEESVSENKSLETNHYQELKQGIADVSKDAAVIKSILEYHFSTPKK